MSPALAYTLIGMGCVVTGLALGALLSWLESR
jgi:hypothetical protein